ncbi:UV radiation resistance-associated gene [Olea europaea subsp. europaea]|uniref:UV radiation resistance-associated protein n=1 Tax=Olea europaea subsp. europaea TaxID=158383 RepID=A0A8S0QHQ7_OLEEU|nr:UV radiation resistance-associated gene [Olea europaea subsp. europaea]
MESKKPTVNVQEEKQKGQEDQEPKVIEWEDYEQELARLCSLTSALEEAKRKKNNLEQKLHSLTQVEAESLSQSNELDEMNEKLESRKLVMGNMSMHSKVVEEKVRKEEERLSSEIRSLLVAGTALSEARKRMQDSHRSLTGEKGYVHLNKLQKLLRLRQQYMLSQVSLLYPVKFVIGRAPEQELESFTSSTKSGVPSGSKPVDQGSLTIAGLNLTVIPSTKMSFFTDKKEVQRSSTALGYVAHAVSLIASYLQVPLRYPLRLGGSRSYICDYAPAIDHSMSSSDSNSISSTSLKPVEFPLFLEGQDSTRAAYAVFLLNKDLEQLLNFIGVKSLGPRHVLANLKELLRTILSSEYIEM